MLITVISQLTKGKEKVTNTEKRDIARNNYKLIADILKKKKVDNQPTSDSLKSEVVRVV